MMPVPYARERCAVDGPVTVGGPPDQGRVPSQWGALARNGIDQRSGVGYG
jgi:hypothetical protein